MSIPLEKVFVSDDLPSLSLDPVGGNERVLLWTLMQEHLEILSRYAPLPRTEDGEWAYRWFDEYFTCPDRRFPFIARIEGEPVGLLLLHRLVGTLSPVGRASLSMAELYVRPARQRMGIGRCLVRWTAEQARARKLVLHWWVLARNRPAHRFYGKVAPRIADSMGWRYERHRVRNGNTIWILYPR